jgi:tRNA modification GTPase
VALVGRPNVGKSSLLNALLRTERAIVTPVAGTTRDTVEEKALIGGLAVQLVDTAGLTPSDDPVERIGVERSRAAACSADLLLLVLDGSEPLLSLDASVAAELHELTESESARPAILVLNKADLPRQLSDETAQALWPGAPLVATSTITGNGLAALEGQIAALALGGTAQAGDVLVSSARHKDALRRGLEHIQAAEVTLADGLPLDFVAIDLRAALEALGEITGETATADLLDRIFAEFCIGK